MQVIVPTLEDFFQQDRQAERTPKEVETPNSSSDIESSLRESSCPVIPALPEEECAGKLSSCWSPGGKDIDCKANEVQ